MTTAINSSIKLDLPASPFAKSQSIFNESLVAYSALRSLLSAASTAFGQDILVGEAPDVSELLMPYGVNNLAKVTLKVGADILAGRFLECYKSGGEYLVRHTRVISYSDMSRGSIGLSSENRNAGEYVVVYIAPSIIPGFSGLTVGRSYRYYDDGQFTDTALSIRYCGVAVSDRHMRIISFGKF